MPIDLPYPTDDGRTHYEGCWRDRGHHNCAAEMVERLRASNERLRAERDEARAEVERLRAARDADLAFLRGWKRATT
jgi:hypothetical protein